MSVTVVNVKDYKGRGTYIGRARDPKDAVFGNPYSHLEGTLAKYKVATREEAIERYREWIQGQWEQDEYFRLCLTGLAKEHAAGKKVVLACHCYPDPCHGNVLKEYIEGLVALGVVESDEPF